MKVAARRGGCLYVYGFSSVNSVPRAGGQAPPPQARRHVLRCRGRRPRRPAKPPPSGEVASAASRKGCSALQNPYRPVCALGTSPVGGSTWIAPRGRKPAVNGTIRIVGADALGGPRGTNANNEKSTANPICCTNSPQLFIQGFLTPPGCRGRQPLRAKGQISALFPHF